MEREGSGGNFDAPMFVKKVKEANSAIPELAPATNAVSPAPVTTSARSLPAPEAPRGSPE